MTVRVNENGSDKGPLRFDGSVPVRMAIAQSSRRLRSGERARMRRAARGSLIGSVIAVREMRKLGDTGRQVAPISIDLSRQRGYGAHVSVTLCLNGDRFLLFTASRHGSRVVLCLRLGAGCFFPSLNEETTMAITLKQYWKNRDVEYANELTPTIIANAKETVRRANLFLKRYHDATGATAPDGVNSGWRPPSVNAATKNAAKNSPHLTAQAVDLSDDLEAIDRWIASPEGLQALIDCDLYAEAPKATPRWAHLQTRAIASGKRVFNP